MLRKCLEMRKRKICTRDPSLRFGQYGGKPLWTMSRDIDRVIADNHPRIRRMKRVQEAMRQSLESGAILDNDAVSRRMEAFFQLQNARTQKDKSPERPKDAGQSSPSASPIRNVFKLPSLSGSVGGVGAGQRPSPDQAQPKPSSQKGEARAQDKQAAGTASKPEGRPGLKDRLGGSSEAVADAVSLNVDSKGRLRGIRTRAIDTIHEGEDSGEEEGEEERRVESGTGGGEADKAGRRTGGRRGQEQQSGAAREEGGGEAGGRVKADERGKQYRANSDKHRSRPRSKLILPPIESSKALVSRT